ncbi:alpha/beta hydrolase [Actinospica sp. MGRD01-02]|uniref:Alpha/beta hydrolase n=1 Tax=Actinospica acidithermotolerans TaxID=2828514 RepID=A0A941E888_9ACTN|nr:alpha/beta hydrolase [Actinospica acidithermotolerans]MBR7826881.1 alpha/beta hydrolase [Actinospica acidithermotolerans]
MKLNTREWGAGERAALLVHGIMSDSRTWHRVGPALAGHGYRVIGVDLRGHGASDRSDAYPAAGYGTDIVETVEALGLTGVEVAIGHSLGGLAVLDAVEAGLRAGRAVYVDPAWRIARRDDGFDPAVFVEFADTATYDSIAMMAPRWDAETIELELATFAAWDRRTALDLSSHAHSAPDEEAETAGGGSGLPLRPDVPSLIMLAAASQMLDTQDAETLRERGFEIRTVPGAGHSIHRDDFEGFMTALEGWI